MQKLLRWYQTTVNTKTRTVKCSFQSPKSQTAILNTTLTIPSISICITNNGSSAVPYWASVWCTSPRRSSLNCWIRSLIFLPEEMLPAPDMFLDVCRNFSRHNDSLATISYQQQLQHLSATGQNMAMTVAELWLPFWLTLANGLLFEPSATGYWITGIKAVCFWPLQDNLVMVTNTLPSKINDNIAVCKISVQYTAIRWRFHNQSHND